MRTFLLIVVTALLSILSLIYAQLNNVFPWFFALLNLSWSTPQIASDTIPADGAACTTPRWETVEHGQVFLSFAAETWSVASWWCESRSTVCNNWSWSAEQEPLPAKTCVLETPKNCEINWFLIAHGTSKEFYAFDESNQSCESQTRTCTDGEMDGDESYEYVSCPSSCPTLTGSSITAWTGVTCPECPCLDKQPEIKSVEAPKPEIKKPTISTTTTTVKPNIQPVTAPLSTTSPSEPNCPSPFGWKRREPGQQWTAYKQAVAPYGTECEQVSIVCSYGSIRYWTKGNAWDVALWVASTCRVGEPANCESACGIIQNGNQVVTFWQSIIPFANGQVCNDIKITSTCSNGVLSPAAWSACSCQIAPPAACTAPNGQTVAHEGSITLYQEPSVQAVAWDGADTCLRQFRRCFNGTFVDAWWNPSPLTYQYPSCTVIPPQG